MAPPSPTRDLLAWYDRHRRDLPWRAAPGASPDPYAVWLSEIMLQQTTVAAVKPYFARFLALWPDVRRLASAPREEVMRQWAGLGYYVRARNLHDCARAIVERYGGMFPSSEAGLRALPGVGDYTAAAVAAIAFGAPAAVIDGNVERVFARMFAVETPLPKARAEIRSLVAAHVPADRPGDFAQACMDLGATLCTPKSPACALCPLGAGCLARAAGVQATFPRRLAKPAKPRRHGAIVVLEREDGAVLVRTRPQKGLLGGMAEFYGTTWTASEPDIEPLRRVADASLRHLGLVEHVFTHFALELEVYGGRPTNPRMAEPGYRWVQRSDLGGEAFPTLMLKVLALARSRTLQQGATMATGKRPPGQGILV